MSTSWSVKDKKVLLRLLQKHGDCNLEIIHENMPHKSIAEISYICDKHTKLAMKEWCSSDRPDSANSQTVDKWMKILKKVESSKRGYVQDVVARVLKYIALFEKRAENSHICLRDCYLVLSDISNGWASKKLNETSSYFLFECLTKLAESIKKGEIESYKSYLKSVKYYNRLVQNKASTPLNPLHIPKPLLKMTKVDKQVDIFD